MMKTKFDLFETLAGEGYVEKQNQLGWIYFTKTYETASGIVVVDVETNRIHEYARICYSDERKCFKAKTYKSTGKRTYNAIKETLDWYAQR